MTGQIRRTPRFLDDIAEIAIEIDSANPAAADRFLEETENTLQALAEMPLMGRVFEAAPPGLAGLRVFNIKSFRKYLVFYLPTPNGVELVRIIHGARDIPTLLEEI